MSNAEKTTSRNRLASAYRSKAVRPSSASTATSSSTNGSGSAGLFTAFAQRTARLAGKPGAFLTASAVVVLWCLSGPAFGYSDTWQLVINTGTTIVTFLMVFLIQHTQNRDTTALQVKLDELIVAMHGAENRIAGAEDLSDEELELLHDAYRKRACETLDRLDRRRSGD